MIQFSVPVALSIFAASSAVAVTSVAIAVPALQSAEPSSISSTATPTVTSSAVPTPSSTQAINGDSPFAEFPDQAFFEDISLHDLPVGFTTLYRSSGVMFSYVGECLGPRPVITIWANNGLMKSSGGGYCDTIKPGQMVHSGAFLTWNEDIRNGYCNSPAGAATAYRAEIYGNYSEWVPIPEEYKQCVNGRAPEGPLPAGETAPPPPPVSTVPPVDAPPTTELISPAPGPVQILTPEPVPAPITTDPTPAN